MLHLGEAPGPDGAVLPVNLPLARNTIDVLGLLKDKTAGNLDDEEQKLIDTLLYELRNTFVAKSEPGTGEAETP